MTNTETLTRNPVGKTFARILGRAMESRLRYRFFAPEKVLQGVGDLQGMCVLELGCGTGFFTIPIARMIGEHGRLVAMDILPESVELVAKKVEAAGLQNVRVMKGDALHTNLEGGTFDKVLLFGVIPAPMVPTGPLMIELHRILKPEGILSVWPPLPPGWLPNSVLKSDLFELVGKDHSVYNFRNR